MSEIKITEKIDKNSEREFFNLPYSICPNCKNELYLRYGESGEKIYHYDSVKNEWYFIDSHSIFDNYKELECDICNWNLRVD